MESDADERGMPQAGPSADALVDPGERVDAWFIESIRRFAAAGRLDLDLPITMHLPLFATGDLSYLTPRQLIGRTTHMGAPAYETWLAANPRVDALTAQAFLLELGLDDTPGERPNPRPAELDSMAWLIEALGGGRPVHEVLASQFAARIERGESPRPDEPAVRAARRLAVPSELHRTLTGG